MSNPILYRLLDMVEPKWARLTRQPVPPPALQQITEGAFELNERKTGRHDAPDRIPSRVLVVPDNEQDRKLVADMGAEYIAGEWVVPDDHNLDDFELWWPAVADDLLDKTQRGMMTKDGNPIEGYQLPSDVILGGDSTATPLMYGALPVIAALAYLAEVWKLHWLAAAFLALSIPFLVTIKQGEGIVDAVKSACLLLLGPLMLSTMLGSAAENIAKAAASGKSDGIKSLVESGGSMISMLALLAIVGTLAFSAFDSKFSGLQLGGGKSYEWGAFFERLKHNLKWMALGLVVVGLCLAFLPNGMQPFAFYFLASLYPMIHTESNYNSRTKELQQLGMVMNLAKKGGTAQSHVEPRMKQALNAHYDTSPLITIGIAQGWLTKKQYNYAPDENMPMKLSSMDMMTHVLVFGMIGIGKSESVLRPLAKQWVENKWGGALFLCGKGTLPGDLSGVIDLMIRPGIDYAPFQGLDATGVAYALNAINVGGKADVWDNGAKDFIDHLTVLHQALHEHEKSYKAYAQLKVRDREMDITWLTLEIARKMKLGADTSEDQLKLQRIQGVREDWIGARDEERKWLWNVDTLARLAMLVNQIRMENGVPSVCKDILKAAQKLGFGASAERRAEHPDSIHPDLGKGTPLDGTLDFFLQGWPAMDEKQRSSFMITVNLRLVPLTRGKKLVGSNGVHWKMLEKGEDVTCCLFGKTVGPDMPETKYGKASLAITTFVKQQVYARVTSRQSETEAEWRARGELPLMIMIDEAHMVMDKQEVELASISRSLRASFVCATQTIESLISRLDGENDAVLLANTFQSYICLQTSQSTYDFMSRRMGPASIVKFPEQVMGIDYRGALRKFAMSPLNDPDHINAAGMQKLLEMGAGSPKVNIIAPRSMGGWGSQRVRNISENEMTMDLVVNVGGHREEGPLFEDVEFSSLLQGPGNAIVYLRRAGYPRADFAKLLRVGPDELRTKAVT